jgi:hypothetical protein
LATTVYEVKELVLDDNSTVTCKPANIAVTRKGNELLSRLGDEDPDNPADSETEGVHRLLDIVCLCLKRQRPDFEIDQVDDEGVKTGKKITNYELMEELFDYDTMFEVIYIFLGVRLNDPKLLQAAMELAEAQRAQETTKEEE